MPPIFGLPTAKELFGRRPVPGSDTYLFWRTAKGRGAQSPLRSRTSKSFRNPDASYAKRYEILLTKLLRERLYDGASLLLTTRQGGADGKFSSPSEELNFRTFATGLSPRDCLCENEEMRM